jgi:low affinity Fe/Cu permease
MFLKEKFFGAENKTPRLSLAYRELAHKKIMKKPEPPSTFRKFFINFSNWTARNSGNPGTFVLAISVVILWVVTGPVFGFSDTWQLVINTGTTIVTFLMVFLIQNTQNRDSIALQAKLDELVRSVKDANNKFVGIEKLSEPELEELREECEQEAKTELENSRNQPSAQALEK